MGEEMMLVRTPGGDVIRRRVVRREEVRDITGKVLATVLEPETHDGEYVMRTVGDKLPTIIKTTP